MTHKPLRSFSDFFFSAAFLLLVCVEGFHHHEDGFPHADCSLCVAAQQTAVVSHHTSSLCRVSRRTGRIMRFCSCAYLPERQKILLCERPSRLKHKPQFLNYHTLAARAHYSRQDFILQENENDYENHSIYRIAALFAFPSFAADLEHGLTAWRRRFKKQRADYSRKLKALQNTLKMQERLSQSSES